MQASRPVVLSRERLPGGVFTVHRALSVGRSGGTRHRERDHVRAQLCVSDNLAASDISLTLRASKLATEASGHRSGSTQCFALMVKRLPLARTQTFKILPCVTWIRVDR